MLKQHSFSQKKYMLYRGDDHNNQKGVMGNNGKE
jgi:hypothetical protein